MSTEFATLRFTRQLAVPRATLWQAWSAPAARAIWSAPDPSITVEFLEADTRPGGREVSLCKVAGEPDMRCECVWLDIAEGSRSVNSEVISCDGACLSAALVTAEISGDDQVAQLDICVQLASLSSNTEADYRQGFEAGLDHLVEIANRMMVIERVIRAPRAQVWGAWANPEALPQWWGPDGFHCRTRRVDLRQGGEWVFDMIAADGQVFPNHHLYRDMTPERRIGYVLLWGENGPKHADAWVNFADEGGGTRVTLVMVFATAAEYQSAKGFGAEALGLQTLGKLARLVGAD